MLVPLGRSWARMACGAAAQALWAASAQAATITVAVPLPGYFSVDNGTDAFVPRFDAGLGTLTGVTAQLTGTLTPILDNLQTVTPPPASPILFSPSVSIAYPAGGDEILPTQSAPITVVNGRAQAAGAPEAVDLIATLAPTLP